MAAENALNDPRLYRDAADLERMRTILVEGRQAANGSFYIHPGDLSWWLYYLPYQTNPWQNIYLWDDEVEAGKLIAWTLFSSNWRTFDVFIAPTWHGSRLAEQIYAWSANHLAQTIRLTGAKEIRTMWISEQDRWLRLILTQNGFIPSDTTTIQFEQTLNISIPTAALPDGYHMRSVTGEQELKQRALAQYATFESSLPFEIYCQRYLRFMQSPVYIFQHDLVIEAPGGEIAAFCIIWVDETNRVGQLEPVGVHPAFQRNGLGKALVFESLRRMHSYGMLKAIVNTEDDNLPAQRLYQATGFTIVNQLITYIKQLPEDSG